MKCNGESYSAIKPVTTYLLLQIFFPLLSLLHVDFHFLLVMAMYNNYWSYIIAVWNTLEPSGGSWFIIVHYHHDNVSIRGPYHWIISYCFL